MGKADYYEDVLVSTETTYQKLKDAKEGRTIQRSNKKVKVKDNEVGINKGSGAYTFLYKHMLEMRRRSRFIFVDTLSIFLIAGGAAAGYFFKKYAAPVETVYGVLGVAVYMQFIFSMMGKLKGELLKPYIFLIPEKSVKKVFAASLTSLSNRRWTVLFYLQHFRLLRQFFGAQLICCSCIYLLRSGFCSINGTLSESSGRSAKQNCAGYLKCFLAGYYHWTRNSPYCNHTLYTSEWFGFLMYRAIFDLLYFGNAGNIYCLRYLIESQSLRVKYKYAY
jgi:hypothetical protein